MSRRTLPISVVTQTIIGELSVTAPTVVLGPTLASVLAGGVSAERRPVSEADTVWFHVTVDVAGRRLVYTGTDIDAIGFARATR